MKLESICCLSLIISNIYINFVVDGLVVILNDPIQYGGATDPNWIYTGAYSLTFGNANACPSNYYCTVLYGAPNGGSTLTNKFSNIRIYDRVGIYYYLTVSNLPAGTYCDVEYKYGDVTTTWQTVKRYTDTGTNVKYNHGWWLGVPENVGTDVIYIRFHITAPTDSSRCYLNNFYFFRDQLLPDDQIPPIYTPPPTNVEKILFYNTLHDGDVDPDWIWLGAFEDKYSNDNQAPSGRYHVVLYGAPNGGSKLVRKFTNMNVYTDIKVNYGLAVTELAANTFCSVQYSFDSATWVDAMSYTTTGTDVVKYPNQFSSIPTPPFGDLYIRFYMGSTTGRCNLNNFILYGTISFTSAPTPPPSVPVSVEEIIYYNTLQDGNLDIGWIWTGSYDNLFNNNNQSPSGKYHVVIFGTTGGSSLQRLFTNMDGYNNIKVNYGLAVTGLDTGTYCRVQYSNDGTTWTDAKSYTSSGTSVVKYPNEFASIPTPSSSDLYVRFYIDSTQGRCNLNNFVLFGTEN